MWLCLKEQSLKLQVYKKIYYYDDYVSVIYANIWKIQFRRLKRITIFVAYFKDKCKYKMQILRWDIPWRTSIRLIQHSKDRRVRQCTVKLCGSQVDICHSSLEEKGKMSTILEVLRPRHWRNQTSTLRWPINLHLFPKLNPQSQHLILYFYKDVS